MKVKELPYPLLLLLLQVRGASVAGTGATFGEHGASGSPTTGLTFGAPGARGLQVCVHRFGINTCLFSCACLPASLIASLPVCLYADMRFSRPPPPHLSPSSSSSSLYPPCRPRSRPCPSSITLLVSVVTVCLLPPPPPPHASLLHVIYSPPCPPAPHPAPSDYIPPDTLVIKGETSVSVLSGLGRWSKRKLALVKEGGEEMEVVRKGGKEGGRDST